MKVIVMEVLDVNMDIGNSIALNVMALDYVFIVSIL
tara:strand:+ start:439 stop:546 length:108 start_codon:yes stop_codon:yes gene_type:complete